MRRFVILLWLLPVASGAYAQTTAGVQYSHLINDYPRGTRAGVGAFFTHTPGAVGVDVSTSLFLTGEVGGNAWQLLAGPRFGVIRRGVGVYGRVRPGFIRFSERFFALEVVCIAVFPPPESCLAPRTNVALDLGATIEAYPSASTVLRFDLGDTLTRYRREPLGAHWSQGLQLVAGAGWTF